ncbi:helix-turn-helix domain-containing protein [Rhodococcus opacus]|uniref:helix-turn-helix domain-containing protein n=1 Tax=Rhodococcus opacus TaxID=37919 RepID=UPI001C468325|nr:LysR family transcriptional regulator [Rhodococcus opacus]MBV6759837.1 LysR family transcriptional regulator [Rhodococcus opacus]
MVDLLTLKHVISAIEEEQVGQAAIRENIAASTAAERIQVLEDIVGVELLERTQAGVIPTPAGVCTGTARACGVRILDEMRAEIAALIGRVQASAPLRRKRLQAHSRPYGRNPKLPGGHSETDSNPRRRIRRRGLLEIDRPRFCNRLSRRALVLLCK